MQTVVYYVRDSSLWRAVGSSTPEELVEDVCAGAADCLWQENQIQDGIVNNIAANTVTNWANIVSVSVSLPGALEQNRTNIDSQTYNLLGTNVRVRSTIAVSECCSSLPAALRNVAI